MHSPYNKIPFRYHSVLLASLEDPSGSNATFLSAVPSQWHNAPTTKDSMMLLRFQAAQPWTLRLWTRPQQAGDDSRGCPHGRPRRRPGPRPSECITSGVCLEPQPLHLKRSAAAVVRSQAPTVTKLSCPDTFFACTQVVTKLVRCRTEQAGPVVRESVS